MATKQKPRSLHKTLALFKAGKLDIDGFQYDGLFCT